jgi:DNA-binding transcriptional LysR family regulator
MDINLNRVEVFVTIVDMGSLTRAADALSLTKAMLSMHLKHLEAELGCTLLTRTTRRLVLTDVGERFYLDCVKLLADARRAIEQARAGHATLSGELRVTSTLEFGTYKVVPALAAFARMHPDLDIEFSGTTGLANLVADRFDLAVRLGHLGNSNYRATPLGQFEIVLVASPAYVQRHGLPRSPEELRGARWIVLTGFDQRIKMTKRDGSTPPFPVPFRGAIHADSALAKLHFVLADAGIAVLPTWVVQEDLQRDRLVRLLPDYEMPQQGVYAVFPDNRYMPARVRRFIEFLREYMQA